MSTTDPLNEREFELINIVGAQIATNQRDLSRHMDLSLGTINMLVRRLVTKGYIRIKQLNKKKVEYILTSKGFSEKTRKSIKYTLKTLSSISAIKDSMRSIIMDLYQKGERSFFVLGKSDLAYLVEIVLKEYANGDYKVSYIQEFPDKELDGTILICREEVGENPHNIEKRVDLIAELAQDEQFILQERFSNLN